jgi:hypothetical protein
MGGSLNSAMAGAALSRDSAVNPAAAAAANVLLLSSRAALAARSATHIVMVSARFEKAWQPNVPVYALITEGVCMTTGVGCTSAVRSPAAQDKYLLLLDI